MTFIKFNCYKLKQLTNFQYSLKTKFTENQLQMNKETTYELYKYKQSIVLSGTKQILTKLEERLPNQKSLSQDKKQAYIRTIKQINWSITKIQPYWPDQIQLKVDCLKNNLMSFQNQLNQISKGSSLFCGSGGNPKQLDKTFRTILTYEQFFFVVGVYQTQEVKQKEKMVEQVFDKIQKQKSGSKHSIYRPDQSQVKKQIKQDGMCKYCELMLSISICPNGFIAKKLLKQLPDTEWIAGILYEEGTVVDKNLQKAIVYYQQAKKKKNPEAIYRLGSLNERELYGKRYEYINMWQQSSQMGHLQALTDMGYLYENGLYDQDSNKQIIAVNQQKALKYYMKASQKNFPRALNNLATFYYNSKQYKNEKKCLEYLQRAADAEYIKSLHNLALIYYEGSIGASSIQPDQVKARGLLKRAAQKGDIEARVLYIQKMLNQSQKCNQQDFVQIHKYCRQIIAKQQQTPEPYYFLGIISQNGYGVPSQPKISLLYYSIAASYGSDAAFIKLGECYKNGFGVQKDSKQAIRCFQQAAKQNSTALVYLGQIFEQGSHDLKVNNQKAFQYYYEACNNNVPQAFTHLGNMYLYGKHVNKNQQKANQYFQKGKQLQKMGGRINQSRLNSSSQLIQSSYYRRR